MSTISCRSTVAPRRRTGARGALFGLLALLAAVVVPVPATAVPAGCVTETVEAAAETLHGPGTRVIHQARLAGMDTALVLQPSIMPGVRHRLLRAGERWCTTEAFNVAWTAAGGGSTTETASAFAQVSAAPYFDGVTATDAVEVFPGVVALTTHATTNGITADWLVIVDGEGVARARWTSTGFAVPPFDPQWEGLTATPGVTRSHRRVGEAITPVEALLPVPVEHPSLTTSVTMPDGFRVDVEMAGTTYAPDSDVDTGVGPVDMVRIMAATAEENYLDFLSWGLEDRWPGDVGTIFVDDSIATTCIACVQIQPDFNIHISTATRAALLALGYDYPGASDHDVLNLVVGHEMFHNFQSAYAEWPDDTGRWAPTYGEGTARMQEALHDHAPISDQPASLINAQSTDGCNGFDFGGGLVWVLLSLHGGVEDLNEDMGAAMARGPFTDQVYSSCFAWLPIQAHRGTDGLVALMDQMQHADLDDEPVAITTALEAATGEPLAEDLAVFAAAALSGHGMRLPGGEAGIDWGRNLERWVVPRTGAGATLTRGLGHGGMIGVEVTEEVRPTASAGSAVAEIRATSDGVRSRLIDLSDPVVARPDADERVWVVAIHTGAVTTTVNLEV